jgi:hypothetical protein
MSNPIIPSARKPSLNNSPTPPKLLDQVLGAIRLRHYNIRTEQAYTDWVKPRRRGVVNRCFRRRALRLMRLAARIADFMLTSRVCSGR